MGAGREKRQDERKPVFLPAIIMEKNSTARDFKTVKVPDISLGGIGLCVPRSLKMEVFIGGESNEYYVIFKLPDVMQPINVTCKSERIFECGEGIHVGAAFVDSDSQSYQTLQEYLI